MDLSLKELKYITSTCWDKKYQQLTIDKMKYKFTGRHGLGLNSIFVPDSSTF